VATAKLFIVKLLHPLADKATTHLRDLLLALHNLTWSLGAVERWSYEKLRIQTNHEAENGGQSLPMKNKQKARRRRRRLECSAKSNIYYRGEKN
jgi:hypothetical protein